ncbi:MAG: fibrobacter succinogenes major paralogous domain-containing protein [Mediterranea sp.]|nr:fibrobacter succinogenes major paralogous domain-containing protein [Mediterranea sp.]
MVTFYPASGYRYHTSGALTGTGSDGDWWSSAVSGAIAYHLAFYSSVVYPAYSSSRAYGLAVRCVQYLLLFKYSVL